MVKKITLRQLAELTGSSLIGDPLKEISGFGDLDAATSHEASFLHHARYINGLKNTQAGCVFIPPGIDIPEGKNLLISDNPYEAFQKALDLFYADDNSATTGFEGIHPTAVIHPTAQIGPHVTIGPQAVIDKEVVIEEGTFIGAGCYVGPGTTIGNHSYLYPNITIREKCIIGNRVILQPGVVIGGCGFGFRTDKEGRHIKINHYGNVVVEDDVEIGANTTVDRAKFKSTLIKQGTKIDNLVQIGHNVEVGEHNLIVALTGIAGSTKTDHHVVIGGQVGIDGHLKIGPKVMIAARSGVTKSLDQGVWSGAPAMPLQDFNRMIVHLRKIEKLVEQVKDLQEKV